jgi:hypothetical protein
MNTDAKDNQPRARKAVSKRIRFELFKRDSFTCQYCGRKAPAVLLEADHIEPAAKGGGNNILNLITEAMRSATQSYLQFLEGRPTNESVEAAWHKVGAFSNIARLEQDPPGQRRLFYIRGILRKWFDNTNSGLALQLLKEALDQNASLESLESGAKTAWRWKTWKQDIEHLICERSKGTQS